MLAPRPCPPGLMSISARRRLAAVCLGLLCSCQLLLAEDQGGDDSYIVVLKPGTGQAQVEAACAEAEAANYGRFSGVCLRKFSSVLTGFAGTFSGRDLAALKAALGSSIAYIERDRTFRITGSAQPEWIQGDALPDGARRALRERLQRRRSQQQQGRRQRHQARRGLPEQEQQDPQWDLDRIDQASSTLDHLYHYNYTGTGVNVYVLDTGIRFTHQEFRSQQDANLIRARPGFSAFGDNVTNDCNGHGTHTAATVGGLTYGVAKNVSLWAVRAMDCQGDAQVSNILAAFEWIADNFQPPAVVSMSVAGDFSSAVNEAARRLVEDHDVPVVVAAGNEYSDACQVSPASAPAVIAVGASDEQDRRWAQSNFGPCVDVHAPGVALTSAVNTSDTATMVKTGTSMATPHVTGVLALYLEPHPGASSAEVREKINSAALVDVLQDDSEGYGTWNPTAVPQALDISDTPNRLLYSMLSSQAVFSPGIVSINPGGAPASFQLSLHHQPSSPVTVKVSGPLAQWAGAPLANVQPASLTIQPAAWNTPQTVTVAPTALANGNYHINFTFLSQDPYFSNALQTVKVLDGRQLTGDTLADPRVIPSLPFQDTDDSSRFTDQYFYSTGDPLGSSAPDVVYKYTATSTGVVEISTCGSTFDTKLYVFSDPSQQPYIGNDDATCVEGPKSSRITTTLTQGQSYWIVVDGFSSGWATAQGLFQLAVVESASSSF